LVKYFWKKLDNKRRESGSNGPLIDVGKMSEKVKEKEEEIKLRQADYNSVKATWKTR